MYMYNLHAWSLRGQTEGSVHWSWSYIVVSHPVGSGNQTVVICKNKCPQPLSLLSSP